MKLSPDLLKSLKLHEAAAQAAKSLDRLPLFISEPALADMTSKTAGSSNAYFFIRHAGFLRYLQHAPQRVWPTSRNRIVRARPSAVRCPG